MGLVAAERLEKLQWECQVAVMGYQNKMLVNIGTIVQLAHGTFAKHLE